MANKRDSAAQKRARANRAQREALTARTTAASTPRPSRAAPAAARRTGGKVASPRSGKAEAAATGRGNDKKSDRPARRPRLGDTKVDVDELEGSHFRKVLQVPGGAQLITATAFSVASFVLTLGQKVRPAEGDTDKKAKYTRTLIDVLGTPRAVAILIVPVLALVAAYFVGIHKQRRRIWLGIAVLLALYSIGSGFIYYVFPLVLIGFALFRAAKVEGPNEPMFARQRGRARATDEDETVDEDDDEFDDDELDEDLDDDLDDDDAARAGDGEDVDPEHVDR